MSSDFPTLAEVGEENCKEHEHRFRILMENLPDYRDDIPYPGDEP
jgi:hypothetical protein